MHVLKILLVATALAMVVPSPGRTQVSGSSATGTIGESAYRKLEQAHAALAAGRYADAEAQLVQMQAMPLNDYERSLVYQTFGYLYAEQGNYGQALEFYERCLALDALAQGVRQDLLLALAGLYSAQARWEESIRTLLRWLPNEPAPSPDALIMLAAAYAELSRYGDALPWVEKAVENHPEPIENWYQLLVAVRLQLHDYDAAARTLRQMLAYWPDKLSHWETLSAVYRALGNDIEATSTMSLAYRGDLLQSESKLLDLARLMRFIGDSYQAAGLIESEMATGRIGRTQPNLALLLDAWTAAREFDQAIAVIDRLAPMTGDGTYYLHKARLLTERTRWADVIPAAEQAIARGGLDNPGAPWLLKGMSEAELGRFADAIDSLTQARNAGDAGIRSQAEGWLEYVREQRRIGLQLATFR